MGVFFASRIRLRDEWTDTAPVSRRERAVNETEDFLGVSAAAPTEADAALHNGDAAPRLALWFTRRSVTLFGALLSKSRCSEIGPSFEWLASRFSNGAYTRHDQFRSSREIGRAHV